MTHLRIGLLEDHEIARRGLLEMLRSIPIVSEILLATDATDAREIVEAGLLDVLIMTSDIGAEARQLAAERPPTVRLIVLVRSTEPGHVIATARLQANAFLIEPTLTTDALAEALTKVDAGVTVMPTILADHLMAAVRTGGGVEGMRSLTARERAVLGLLAQGLTNKEIARALRISEHGVKRHVATILAKMHCANRTMAVARAMEEGLLV